MDDLIEALQIMRKYGNTHNPTNCSHDEINVDIENEDVSDEDVERLYELSFFKSEEFGGFSSFRFGSC